MKELTLSKYREVMKRLQQECESSEPSNMEIALAFYRYGVQIAAEANKAEKDEQQAKK